MVLVQPDVPRIYKALRDVKHDIASVLVLDGDVYAHAVVEGATGEVIAWDGWYSDPRDEDEVMPEVTALAEVEWDDWDDMPTKLLIRRTSRWANDRIAFWLIPTFSPAREAAMLVWQCKDQATSSIAAQNMRNGRVVAYWPITDRDVYDRVLRERQ